MSNLSPDWNSYSYRCGCGGIAHASEGCGRCNEADERAQDDADERERRVADVERLLAELAAAEAGALSRTCRQRARIAIDLATAYTALARLSEEPRPF